MNHTTTNTIVIKKRRKTTYAFTVFKTMRIKTLCKFIIARQPLYMNYLKLLLILQFTNLNNRYKQKNSIFLKNYKWNLKLLTAGLIVVNKIWNEIVITTEDVITFSAIVPSVKYLENSIHIIKKQLFKKTTKDSIYLLHLTTDQLVQLSPEKFIYTFLRTRSTKNIQLELVDNNNKVKTYICKDRLNSHIKKIPYKNFNQYQIFKKFKSVIFCLKKFGFKYKKSEFKRTLKKSYHIYHWIFKYKNRKKWWIRRYQTKFNFLLSNSTLRKYLLYQPRIKNWYYMAHSGDRININSYIARLKQNKTKNKKKKVIQPLIKNMAYLFKKKVTKILKINKKNITKILKINKKTIPENLKKVSKKVLIQQKQPKIIYTTKLKTINFAPTWLETLNKRFYSKKKKVKYWENRSSISNPRSTRVKNKKPIELVVKKKKPNRLKKLNYFQKKLNKIKILWNSFSPQIKRWKFKSFSSKYGKFIKIKKVKKKILKRIWKQRQLKKKKIKILKKVKKEKKWLERLFTKSKKKEERKNRYIQSRKKKDRARTILKLKSLKKIVKYCRKLNRNISNKWTFIVPARKIYNEKKYILFLKKYYPQIKTITLQPYFTNIATYWIKLNRLKLKYIRIQNIKLLNYFLKYQKKRLKKIKIKRKKKKTIRKFKPNLKNSSEKTLWFTRLKYLNFQLPIWKYRFSWLKFGFFDKRSKIKFNANFIAPYLRKEEIKSKFKVKRQLKKKILKIKKKKLLIPEKPLWKKIFEIKNKKVRPMFRIHNRVKKILKQQQLTKTKKWIYKNKMFKRLKRKHLLKKKRKLKKKKKLKLKIIKKKKHKKHKKQSWWMRKRKKKLYKLNKDRRVRKKLLQRFMRIVKNKRKRLKPKIKLNFLNIHFRPVKKKITHLIFYQKQNFFRRKTNLLKKEQKTWKKYYFMRRIKTKFISKKKKKKKKKKKILTIKGLKRKLKKPLYKRKLKLKNYIIEIMDIFFAKKKIDKREKKIKNFIIRLILTQKKKKIKQQQIKQRRKIIKKQIRKIHLKNVIEAFITKNTKTLHSVSVKRIHRTLNKQKNNNVTRSKLTNYFVQETPNLKQTHKLQLQYNLEQKITQQKENKKKVFYKHYCKYLNCNKTKNIKWKHFYKMLIKTANKAYFISPNTNSKKITFKNFKQKLKNKVKKDKHVKKYSLKKIRQWKKKITQCRVREKKIDKPAYWIKKIFLSKFRYRYDRKWKKLKKIWKRKYPKIVRNQLKLLTQWRHNKWEKNSITWPWKKKGYFHRGSKQNKVFEPWMTFAVFSRLLYIKQKQRPFLSKKKIFNRKSTKKAKKIWKIILFKKYPTLIKQHDLNQDLDLYGLKRFDHYKRLLAKKYYTKRFKYSQKQLIKLLLKFKHVQSSHDSRSSLALGPFEKRTDSIVYRANWGKTIQWSRVMISNNFINLLTIHK